MRKQESCPEKEMMQGTMPGARRRGRPRTAWMDNIKTWTGLSVEESVRMTEYRDKWRKYVHATPLFPRRYTDSPDCLLILLSISVFISFSLSVFYFLVVGSVLTHVGFRAHVKIASRIASYRVVSCRMVWPTLGSRTDGRRTERNRAY